MGKTEVKTHWSHVAALDKEMADVQQKRLRGEFWAQNHTKAWLP